MISSMSLIYDLYWHLNFKAVEIQDIKIFTIVFNQDQSANEGVSTSEALPHIEASDEGKVFQAQSYEGKEEPSLLHWILAQGNKASLQDIVDYCQKGLDLVWTINDLLIFFTG